MNVNDLKLLNEDKINKFKSESNNDKLEIHFKIKKILENDEAVFFKLPMSTSYKILINLVGKDKIEDTYLELISSNNYKKLRDEFKL